MAQTLQKYSATGDHFQMFSQERICICCLAQNVPLIHLVTCKHRSFLEFHSNIKMDTQNGFVCYLCHGILKKIDTFTKQVQKCCEVLNDKPCQYQKLHHFQYTQVSVLSVDSEDLIFQRESDKEYEEIGVERTDQRNALEFSSESFEVNTDLAIHSQGNISAIEDNISKSEQRNENNASSNKCIKCQILYDEITLSDLDKCNQQSNGYVCPSCNLEYKSRSDDGNQHNGNSSKLQKNTTEVHVICENENCEALIDTSYINEDNQYNDNGYNEYENNDYDDYLDNEKSENDTYNDNHNDITNNDNDNTEAEKHNTKKKKKKSKKERTGFKKITLSLEEQKMELEAKRKGKKYLEAEFKCYNCALGFLFKDTYQAHMMRHEESNGEYKCTTCTLRFASPAVLRAHTQVHSTRVQCRRCGARPSPRHTRHHAAKCRGDVSPCHLCARVFRDASGLQQHLKRFHQSKTSLRSYSCNVCGKNYNNQAAVRTHMIKHLNRKFPCDQCSSIFSSPYTLNQHKKNHDAQKEMHYCEVCQIGYGSRKSLLAHKRNALVHQQTVFECPVCNRVCPNRRSLTSHVSTVHSASKDHGCPTCGARYSSRKSLVRHLATHDPPERETHACHRCPTTFKSRSKLNRHLKQVCEKDKLEEELACYYE